MNFLNVDNSILDELECDSRGIESHDSDISTLLDIANTISTEGMSVNLRSRVNSISPDILSDINERSFTVARTRVNAHASTEGILTFTVGVLVAALRKLIEMLSRAVEWLLERTGESKVSTGQLTRAGSTYFKVSEQLTTVKLAADERINAGTTVSPDFVETYESVIAGNHADIAELYNIAKSSYTRLVRSSLLSPRDTKELLSWANYVKTLDVAFETCTNMFIDVMESVTADGNVIDITLMIGRLADAHDAFDIGIHKLSVKLAQIRIHGIQMPATNSDRPEEFFEGLRRELILAASTPDINSVEADLPNVNERMSLIEDINKYCIEIHKAFAKRSGEHAKLSKQVAKLRKKALSNDLNKNDIVKHDEKLRGDIAMINRRFRKMILAMMRLREIPDLYVKALGQFVGTNGQLAVKQVVTLKNIM